MREVNCMTATSPTEAERAAGFRRIVDKIELGADVCDALDAENGPRHPQRRQDAIVDRAIVAERLAQIARV
jgi:hypothetical protein